MICLHSIRGPILATSQPPPKVGINGYDWYSFVLEVLRKLLMWAPHDRDLENKFWQVCFWPLPFVHAVVLPPGPRLWSVESLLRFCPFPNEMGLNPLPPILNRLRLETNYKIMIWSLSGRWKASKSNKNNQKQRKNAVSGTSEESGAFKKFKSLNFFSKLRWF